MPQLLTKRPTCEEQPFEAVRYQADIFRASISSNSVDLQLPEFLLAAEVATTSAIKCFTRPVKPLPESGKESFGAMSVPKALRSPSSVVAACLSAMPSMAMAHFASHGNS